MSTSGDKVASRAARFKTSGESSVPARLDRPPSRPDFVRFAFLSLAGTFISELVQPPVQRLDRLAITPLFTGLRTTRSLLPKLDVEGSSPFARFCVLGRISTVALVFLGFRAATPHSPESSHMPPVDSV